MLRAWRRVPAGASVRRKKILPIMKLPACHGRASAAKAVSAGVAAIRFVLTSIKMGRRRMARAAIVTGGTRGIGAAIAKGLRAAGFAVAANYAGNDKAAEAFNTETGIQTFKWDVGDPAACEAGIKQVEAALGPVHVLVNNAGITRDGMFHKMSFEQWSAVMRTNLDSMFAMTRPLIDGMRERGAGRIINISSINGQKGQIGQTNYSAAKAGILGFTKALALENARRGITVNAICPGYIDTDMVAGVPEKVLEGIVAQIPIGRLGKASEIASLVVYLASDEAAFITGSILTANGAQYIANG
jgi:acetoacetyl-CoA reductase